MTWHDISSAITFLFPFTHSPSKLADEKSVPALKLQQKMKVVVTLCVLGLALFVVCSATFAPATGGPSDAEQLTEVMRNALRGRRWIEFREGERAWLTEAQILQLITEKAHFMDVTDHPDLRPINGLTSATLPDVLIPRHPVLRPRLFIGSFNVLLFYDGLTYLDGCRRVSTSC